MEKPLTKQEEDLWVLESDLPSLANQAAIELDNHLLERGKGFRAVNRLVSRLKSDGVTGATGELPAQYDPITLGAVSRAVDELIPNPEDRPKLFLKRIQLAAEKLEQLQKVGEDPKRFSRKDLEGLRQYCLALSESASEAEWPLDENDPRHRFGR